MQDNKQILEKLKFMAEQLVEQHKTLCFKNEELRQKWAVALSESRSRSQRIEWMKAHIRGVIENLQHELIRYNQVTIHESHLPDVEALAWDIQTLRSLL